MLNLIICPTNINGWKFTTGRKKKKVKQNITWLVTWKNSQSTRVTLFWWHCIFKHLSFWPAFGNLSKWFLVCLFFWWVFLLCFVFSCLNCRSILLIFSKHIVLTHLNEKSIIIDCVLSITQFAQSSFRFSVCLTPYMQLFILLMDRCRR